MLKKLLKHEWMETWKVPTFMLVALLVITVLAGFSFATPIWESELSGLTILMILLWLIYYFALIAVSLGIMIYLAFRFYKSMFTDEGYLTHTLPVTARQLLISKILPMCAWSALASIAIIVSVFIFGGMAFLFLEPNANVTLGEFLSELGRAMEELFAIENGVNFLVSMVVMMVVGTFSGTLMIVGSITIGQLVGKHKILGSVGAYFAIMTVMQTLSMVVMFPMMFQQMAYTSEDNVFAIMAPMYYGVSVIALVMTIVLYIVSEFIVKRKLNLD